MFGEQFGDRDAAEPNSNGQTRSARDPARQGAQAAQQQLDTLERGGYEKLAAAQAGTLAGLNDIERQNFVAWAKANGPDFYTLVLNSAKGSEEKSQFSIPQEKVTFGGTSYFIDELTLDKRSIYEAINLYNKDKQDIYINEEDEIINKTLIKNEL